MPSFQLRSCIGSIFVQQESPAEICYLVKAFSASIVVSAESKKPYLNQENAVRSFHGLPANQLSDSFR
jgi:hypothetical protein